MAYDDLPTQYNPEPEDPIDPPPTVEMQTRNVLNNVGSIIGTLSFPVGTSESIWTEKLTYYSQVLSDLLRNILETVTVNASTQTTTSSGTASVINGMTKTPLSGKYVAMFSGSIYTAGASAIGEFGLYVDGVLLTETRRDISCNLQLLGGLVTVSLNSIGVGTYTNAEVTLNGNQTIDVRFRSTNGGTIGFKERVLTLIKVQ